MYKMKKILLLILTLILCISFSACGHDETKKSSADVTTTSTEKTLTRSDIVELVPTGLLNLLKYSYDYPNEVNLMNYSERDHCSESKENRAAQIWLSAK